MYVFARSHIATFMFLYVSIHKIHNREGVCVGAKYSLWNQMA